MLDLLYCDHCQRKTAYMLELYPDHAVFYCSVCMASFRAEIVQELTESVDTRAVWAMLQADKKRPD